MICKLIFSNSIFQSTLIAVGDAHVIRTGNNRTLSQWENNEEIEIFREYLRIPTVQPDVDYSKNDGVWKQAFLQETLLKLNFQIELQSPRLHS